jgi:serine/threonine protein kinase
LRRDLTKAARSQKLAYGRIIAVTVTLQIGTKIGPYEIVSSLGAGGMGEVYRATDTRLDRAVAIKVLPGHLSSDTNLQQRLEREARAVSKLSHPNICTLYEIGQQDGLHFLVMELLEGETLEQSLLRGPLSAQQALRVGAQIADSLSKVHKLGITHRDLKPSNIMLTKSGAKLMDFGLAKHLNGGVFEAAQTEMMTELATEQSTHRRRHARGHFSVYGCRRRSSDLIQ